MNQKIVNSQHIVNITCLSRDALGVHKILKHSRRSGLMTAGLLILLLWNLLWPSVSWSYVFENNENGTSLAVFGLGMIRLNYADIDGNGDFFLENEDRFSEGFDTRELLSLTAAGVLFREYTLDGEVHFDPDEYPEWNFLVTVAREENYLAIGDQPNMFSDAYFTRYTEPFRGLTLHLGTETAGVTTFGAVARGETEREELTPDGTTGPYDFTNIPVVQGSEIVILEIRNQHDQNEVLERIQQERDIDYTIDYDSGEVTFLHPLDPENFRGNQVVIVVIYKGQSESRSFNTALFGSRAALMPTAWSNLGMTYVSQFDRESPISESFERRQEAYGIDATFTLGEHWELLAEYAMSQDHAAGSTEPDPQHAFLTELTGYVGEQVEFFAKYQRAERDFLTFANPDILTNQQQIEVDATYRYRPNHSVQAGYSFLQDNLPPDDENPITTTHRSYIEWIAQVREATELFSQYEFIQTTDDGNPAITDTQTHVFLIGGTQGFDDVPVLDNVVVHGEYQFSNREDRADQTSDTLEHQIGAKVSVEPIQNVELYAEQRENFVYDKAAKEYTERIDRSEVGLTLARWENSSADSRYQYRATHDVAQDTLLSEQHVGTIQAKHTLTSNLSGSGKFEFRDATLFSEGSSDLERTSSQTFDIETRLEYTPINDLILRVRYEYAQTTEKADIDTTSREDEAEFRLNYAFDARHTRLTGVVQMSRDELDAPPTPTTKTRKMTYLVSMTRQISDQWDILGQYKRESGELSVDTLRQDVQAEIGYTSGRFLKFVAGYQYTDFADGLQADNDYTAHSAYVNLIGKL